MARRTLLELTQNILSDMDSDEVNSIYDTVEALQVASIIVTTLEAEFNNLDLPSFDRIVQLRSVSDVKRPNYLRYGEDVSTIKTLRYRDGRNRNRYRHIEYLSPETFFDRQLTFGSSTGLNVQEVVDPSGISYWIQNDRCPTYYTSVDNDYLIFDSFDAGYDDTLQNSKTFCLGKDQTGLSSGDQLADDYVPPIPVSFFPLLLAEAKATAFLTLKQMASPKSEQIARRQRSRVQKILHKSKDTDYARSKFNYARYR